MAAHEDLSDSPHDIYALHHFSVNTNKENRRHSTMSTPGRNKKRFTQGNASVLNPMFGSLPDPLRCHPTNEYQLEYHEIKNQIPDYTAFRRRDDEPQFANRRLSFSGVISTANRPMSPEVPMPRTDPMLPSPGIGVALTSLDNNRISYIPPPKKSSFDAGVGKAGINKELPELPKPAVRFDSTAVDADSRPTTRGSGTSSKSTRSLVFGWRFPNSTSLNKSHSTLGIDVAVKPVNADTESKNEVQDKTIYFSSRTLTAPRHSSDDAPSIKVPSCSGLPPGWDNVHDRCIAYLSTHAPLTASGKIPPNEQARERYSIEEISAFLVQRFPVFRSLKKIPHWAIEKRLEMLDLHQNEYFNIPYGGYGFEDWGRDI